MTKLNKNYRSVLTIFTATFLCSIVHSQSEVQELKQADEYIVQSAAASVFQGKKKVGEAVLGALIAVTHQRGPWKYSKELGGWIHTKDLVRLDAAVAAFTKEIQNNSTPDAYHLRGIAYMAQDDWGRAVNDLEEAYGLGESSLTLHINLGNCFFNLGLVDKAKAEFTSVIENFPQDAAAYQARGDLLLDLGELESALADLKKATELSSKTAEIHNSIGVTQRLLGNYSAAVAAYSKCIELDPKFTPAYVNRGFAHKNLKQFEFALKDYEQALLLEPDSPAAQNDLAWLLATCEQENLRDGKRALESALAACRTSEYRQPEYIDTLAAAYARQGEFSKATETTQTAIELFTKEQDKSESQARLELYKNKTPYVEVITKLATEQE